MTKISYSGSEEHFTGKYADPSIAYYYSYVCTYCERPFRLVDPDNNFEAVGATRTVQYRHKDPGEIIAENRSEGVCRDCIQDMYMRQQKEG